VKGRDLLIDIDRVIYVTHESDYTRISMSTDGRDPIALAYIDEDKAIYNGIKYWVSES
jgi:hypothetical protein